MGVVLSSKISACGSSGSIFCASASGKASTLRSWREYAQSLTRLYALEDAVPRSAPGAAARA